MEGGWTANRDGKRVGDSPQHALLSTGRAIRVVGVDPVPAYVSFAQVVATWGWFGPRTFSKIKSAPVEPFEVICACCDPSQQRRHKCSQNSNQGVAATFSCLQNIHLNLNA